MFVMFLGCLEQCAVIYMKVFILFEIMNAETISLFVVTSFHGKLYRVLLLLPQDYPN